MDKFISSNIPNLLRKYRRINNYKQKEVACLLGLKSASPISSWESGRCTPNLVNAILLSLLYKTMVDTLFPDLRTSLLDRLQKMANHCLCEDKRKRICK